jgi:hypothetical protein
MRVLIPAMLNESQRCEIRPEGEHDTILGMFLLIIGHSPWNDITLLKIRA